MDNDRRIKIQSSLALTVLLSLIVLVATLVFILDAREFVGFTPLLTTMITCCVVNVSSMVTIYIGYLCELCLKDRMSHEFEHKRVAYLGFTIDIVASLAALICGSILFVNIGLSLLVSYSLLVFATVVAIHVDLSEMCKASTLDNPKCDYLLKELKNPQTEMNNTSFQ